jgi:hypothetical protein
VRLAEHLRQGRFFSSFDLSVVNGLYIDHCLRVDNNWFGTGHSIFSIAVLNIWVVWQGRVWLFSPFDCVVNKSCQDHLYRCTLLHCTTGHYLTPLWPHFCLQNLSNLERYPYYPTQEVWHLAHVPLLFKRAVGKSYTR